MTITYQDIKKLVPFQYGIGMYDKVEYIENKNINENNYINFFIYYHGPNSLIYKYEIATNIDVNISTKIYGGRGGSAVYGDNVKIYFLAGNVAGYDTEHAEKMIIATSTNIALPKIPFGVYYITDSKSELTKNFGYIFGGQYTDGDPDTRYVQKTNFANDITTNLGNKLAFARDGMAIAIEKTNNYCWIAGGTVPSSYTQRIGKYAYNTDTEVLIGYMSFRSYHGHAFSDGDNGYFWGESDKIDKLQFNTQTDSTLCGTWLTSDQYGAVGCEDMIRKIGYCIGGYYNSTYHQKFDMTTEVTQSLSNLLHNEYHSGSEGIKG